VHSNEDSFIIIFCIESGVFLVTYECSAKIFQLLVLRFQEALRQAALASMAKPKQPQFKVQAHPIRSNLLTIVMEDQVPNLCVQPLVDPISDLGSPDSTGISLNLL